MDTISNIIIQLQNAAAARKETASFPHSKLSLALVEALERAGYVTLLPKKGKKVHKHVEVGLVYEAGTPKLQGVSRVSKPSKRVYRKIKSVSRFRSGYGSLMLSTPKGILTDKEAWKEKVGGEALFQIW